MEQKKKAKSNIVLFIQPWNSSIWPLQKCGKHWPNIGRYWPIQQKPPDIWPVCRAACLTSVEVDQL